MCHTRLSRYDDESPFPSLRAFCLLDHLLHDGSAQTRQHYVILYSSVCSLIAQMVLTDA